MTTATPSAFDVLDIPGLAEQDESAIAAMRAMHEQPDDTRRQPKIRPEPGNGYTIKMPNFGSPDSFKEKFLSATNTGALKLKFDATIVGGKFAGEELRFQSVNITPYTGKNASSAGNLLLAAKINAKPITTPQWAAALYQLSGRTVTHVTLVWEGYDKLGKNPRTGRIGRNYYTEDFPIVNGVRQGFIDVPVTDTTGAVVLKADGTPETRRVFANVNIDWRNTNGK